MAKQKSSIVGVPIVQIQTSDIATATSANTPPVVTIVQNQIGPPWEYPDSQGLTKQRDSYVLSSGWLTTTGAANTDQSWTGNDTIPEDGILVCASLTAAMYSVNAAGANQPSLITAKLIRGSVVVWAMSASTSFSNQGNSVTSEPKITVYKGDLFKFGRDINLPAQNTSYYALNVTIQRFR